MLLANYASDSDSDTETPVPGPSRVHPPPPTAAPIKGKKRTGPIKIGLDIPKFSRDDGEGDGYEKIDESEGRPSKKPKNGDPKGKGSSALLGMLPPPKRKTPALAPSKASSLAVNKSMAAAPKVKVLKEDEDAEDETPRGLLLPSSIARNKAAAARPKAEMDDTAATVDLFGLSSAPESSSSRPITRPKPLSKPPTISSAPLIPDFIPPPPTSTDPYPGYYLLPNGTWQAYDPTYYHSFFPDDSTSALLNPDKTADGRVRHHWDDYERMGGDGIMEISVNEGLEEAKRERERQERMVKPKLPGEDFEYKAIGQIKGLAAERHQLSSLLNSAYTQREELEARIAQNKKNMRAAGQKYGF